MTAVRITRHRGTTSAECEGCNRLHPDATRERVRLHVKQTGHTALVLVEDITRYQREERP